MTLATKITLVRLLLVPVVVIGLLERAPAWPLALFIFCAITDVLDGAAARWRKERTVLGSFLDPLADKCLLVFTFLALAHLGTVPMWVFVVVFSRDLLIFLGWNIIYILTKSFSIEPRWLGKTATLAQMAAIVAVLAPPLQGPVSSYALRLMVVLTVVSMFDYLWLGARKLSRLG